ncbi:MAG: hypothetical protein C4339_04675 [Nitrososphaerota archaeon]|mgnify:CR=1 FL=1
MAWRRGLAGRATRALLSLAFNVLLWLYLPRLYVGQLGQALGQELLPSSLLLAFGLGIAALHAAAKVLEGHGLSPLLSSGAYLASSYFTYLLAHGGRIELAQQGLQLRLDYSPLLWLLLLPQLYGAVRAPLLYLLSEE